MRVSRTIAGLGLAAAVAAAGATAFIAAPAEAGTVPHAGRGNLSAAATCRQQSFLEGTHLSAVGAEVTYGGHTYVCIQAHTSLPGWEPPNVPSLWRLKS